VKPASAIVRLGSNFRSSLGHSNQYGELHGNQASNSSGPSRDGTPMAVASLGDGMSTRNQQWPWYAILTKTGREKNATLLLENSGFECYLPVSKSSRKWSDRTKEIDVPLFPGYLFCRMNPLDRLPVLITPGVVQIVGRGKTPIPLEEHEIAAIQRVASSGLSTMPWPYLQVGQTARIEEGPLQGMSGIVVRIKSGFKLVLSVQLLQRSIAVEIDRSWIRATHPTKAAEHRTSMEIIDAAVV
jgi:transcription antitermination factor NusG